MKTIRAAILGLLVVGGLASSQSAQAVKGDCNYSCAVDSSKVVWAPGAKRVALDPQARTTIEVASKQACSNVCDQHAACPYFLPQGAHQKVSNNGPAQGNITIGSSVKCRYTWIADHDQ